MVTIRQSLRRSCGVWHLRVAFIILLAVSAAFAKNGMQVVVVPVANMYSQPTEKSDVVSQAIYGSNVTLLVSRGEWSRIQTSDRYKGWTPSRHLRIVLSGDGYATSGPTVQVESLFANIYSEPDVTKHKPVITVPFETKLEVAQESGEGGQAEKQKSEGWLHVRLAGMTMAWIQESDVVADPKPLTIAESIDLAKRFLGLPYLWGGRAGSEHATRCGQAGCLERSDGGGAQRLAGWRSAVLWLVRERHHPHRHVHRRRSIHSRLDQWASGGADRSSG
jgi:cell wall-associated NlpC family hydrolase